MATAPTLRARELRNDMPQTEVWLWSRLKRLRAQGYQFRRQRPFKGYFLDFVCLDRKLVVELDGDHHGEPEQAEQDRIKDAVLRRAGFEVIRLWNWEVRNNLDETVEIILHALRERASQRGGEVADPP